MAVESRKRKTPHTETDEEAARAVFRKHFETQFAPLPEPVKPPEHSSDDQEDSDGEGEGEGGEGEEWGGISDGDEDDEEAVEVVDHTSKASDAALMGKRELKAFMVRCPRQTPFPVFTFATPPPPQKKNPISLSLFIQVLRLTSPRSPPAPHPTTPNPKPPSQPRPPPIPKTPAPSSPKTSSSTA